MSIYTVESKSLLASNMAQEAADMETFPVLLGDKVAHFHEVTGGYNESNQFDVVNFVHHVQGVGSPYQIDAEQLSHEVEAHLSDNYYNLDVSGVRTVNDYPDEDYVLSLKVDSYQYGEFSFSEEMSAPVDKRETRYEK